MSILFNGVKSAPGNFIDGLGGGTSLPANASFSTLTVQSNITTPIISNTLTTSTNSYQYKCFDYTLRPTQASQGGQIFAQLQWDAVDTGANYGLIVGANSTTGYIGTIWPGYISMPMQVFGATVDIVSDNETFLHCDGAAGAIGSISTGTSYASSSNAFSSIVAPAGQKANMSALFSTLSNVYPACFS